MIEKISTDYKTLDPADAPDFDRLPTTVETKTLAPYNQLIAVVSRSTRGRRSALPSRSSHHWPTASRSVDSPYAGLSADPDFTGPYPDGHGSLTPASAIREAAGGWVHYLPE
ncbi:hypothetical protein [Kribbella capetownensis]|uniref:hypothetical protein n=1 Tax=Kribbella capetownensis TaxID=1572659 RepID=UPI0013F3A5C1|nr:hypothetical protein [Kribbella capetownensis]